LGRLAARRPGAIVWKCH